MEFLTGLQRVYAATTPTGEHEKAAAHLRAQARLLQRCIVSAEAVVVQAETYLNSCPEGAFYDVAREALEKRALQARSDAEALEQWRRDLLDGDEG